MSYSSAAYFSQSDTSWPSVSASFKKTNKKTTHTQDRVIPSPFEENNFHDNILVELHRTHPDDRERVLLLVVQVLLDVIERVEEDVGHLAPLQVPQSDLTWTEKSGQVL